MSTFFGKQWENYLSLRCWCSFLMPEKDLFKNTNQEFINVMLQSCTCLNKLSVVGTRQLLTLLTNRNIGFLFYFLFILVVPRGFISLQTERKCSLFLWFLSLKNCKGNSSDLSCKECKVYNGPSQTLTVHWVKIALFESLLNHLNSFKTRSTLV